MVDTPGAAEVAGAGVGGEDDGGRKSAAAEFSAFSRGRSRRGHGRICCRGKKFSRFGCRGRIDGRNWLVKEGKIIATRRTSSWRG